MMFKLLNYSQNKATRIAEHAVMYMTKLELVFYYKVSSPKWRRGCDIKQKEHKLDLNPTTLWVHVF